MAKQRWFDYRTWALRTVASCVNSDLSCGFDVADSTPDPEKARNAVQKIIDELNCEANRRDPSRRM